MVIAGLEENRNKRYDGRRMIFVNFKTYKEGTGKEAVKLAKICQEVGKKTSLKIIPLVQAVDIFRLANLGFEVWAQNLDDINFGPNTGQILPQAILAAGARGTILNHSENKLPIPVIGSVVVRCKRLELKTLVCAESIEEAKEIAEFKPDFIAYEPPELIGSRTTSVSTAKPEVIRDFVKEIKKIPIVVGAGVHSKEDVEITIKLGAVGVLVATDVILTKDPKKELIDLAEGFR